jgi:hypothetical protein
LVKITLDFLVKHLYNIHYKELKKENNMFGISKKLFGKTVVEIVDIVGVHHENVTTLQEAVEHLAEVVLGMKELMVIQEARIKELEKEKSNEHK